MWVMGFDPGSSGRTNSILSHLSGPLNTYSDEEFLIGEGHREGLAFELLDSD